ncbi:MAG: 5-oxoprolinase subunit PxpA [Bdellovibrionales bacterium]
MILKVDLNLDAGESPEALADGSEERLYDLVSSVNIACGGHAGDLQTMSQAVKLAKAKGLAIGAHPSFPDRVGFGRTRLSISSEDLAISLLSQMQLLKRVCDAEGVILSRIKAHGALYNLSADDPALGDVLIGVVKVFDSQLDVMGLAGSSFLERVSAAGLNAVAEGFVDRRYDSSGRLRSRSLPDALMTDPEEAGEQAVDLVKARRVQSLCIHSDIPGAFERIRAVRAALIKAGIRICSERCGGRVNVKSGEDPE